MWVCEGLRLVFVGDLRNPTMQSSLPLGRGDFLGNIVSAAAHCRRWDALLGGKAKRFFVRDVVSSLQCKVGCNGYNAPSRFALFASWRAMGRLAFSKRVADDVSGYRF